MNIVELPDDVLLIIVKKLDFRAQYNLMQTCLRLQRIVCYKGVMRECDFSRSKLATIESFNLLFFHHVAKNLHELNLYAVPDLSKASLLPALTNLKQLKTLDVSYTDITIPDMRKIHSICPTIKNVKVTLVFDEKFLKKQKRKSMINKKVLSKCRDAFKHFEKVTFVGSPRNILYSDIPLYLLENSESLKEMNLAAVPMSDPSLYDAEDSCKSLQSPSIIAVNVRDWSGFENYTYRSSYIYALHETNLYKLMSIQETEFIIMKRNKQFGSIYASNAFKELIIKYFLTLYPNEYVEIRDCCFYNLKSIRVAILDNDPQRQKYLLSSSIEISRHSLMLFFDKTKTTFNEAFNTKILKQIEEFLPHYHDSPAYKKLQEIDTTSWNMVYVDGNKKLPKPKTAQQAKKIPSEEKMPDIPTLDPQLKNKNSLKLTVYCKLLKSPLSVSPTSDTLRKITFLNLTGPDVRVDSDFVKVLFENATKLETLNMETADQLCPLESIQCCASLRHIRLVVVNRSYVYQRQENVHLIKELAKCNRLEIVQLIGIYVAADDDWNLLVRECYNMYSLYLSLMASDSDGSKLLAYINKLKMKYDRPCLNVVLSGWYKAGYVAYKDVFELVPSQTCTRPDYLEDMF
ncbi:hypothetical protein JYU34_018396 [Plutella xylostella]|uniref:F-box domain-containing protein n=1 Tax=Plutella xylostella TaxID=51655 RepID=A0ABQ7PYU7_PLUXY|nr:hypothetical protein JYU34_018396 [Plutella xylostella]